MIRPLRKGKGIGVKPSKFTYQLFTWTWKLVPSRSPEVRSILLTSSRKGMNKKIDEAMEEFPTYAQPDLPEE
jgi:hypothetical protein